jgi:hypothetical protein
MCEAAEYLHKCKKFNHGNINANQYILDSECNIKLIVPTHSLKKGIEEDVL